jgi:hypothetical protein
MAAVSDIGGGKGREGPRSRYFAVHTFTAFNDYTFAEKTAVHAEGCELEKNGHLSNDINAVNVWTGKTAKIGPPLSFSDVLPWGPFSRWPEDGLELPPSLLVANRGVPLDRRPALGPEGDSLDDFK